MRYLGGGLCHLLAGVNVISWRGLTNLKVAMPRPQRREQKCQWAPWVWSKTVWRWAVPKVLTCDKLVGAIRAKSSAGAMGMIEDRWCLEQKRQLGMMEDRLYFQRKRPPMLWVWSRTVCSLSNNVSGRHGYDRGSFVFRAKTSKHGRRKGFHVQGANLYAPQEKLLLNMDRAHPGANLQGANLNVAQEEMLLNMGHAREGASFQRASLNVP